MLAYRVAVHNADSCGSLAHKSLLPAIDRFEGRDDADVNSSRDASDCSCSVDADDVLGDDSGGGSLLARCCKLN